MNKKHLFRIAAVLCGLYLASAAHAQNSDVTAGSRRSERQIHLTNSPAAASTLHPEKVSEEQLKKKVTNVNKASTFIGMKVENLQSENLGKVEDLAFDPDSGKISYAVLSVGGFLGLNEKYIAVPLTALTPAPGEDHLILDADKQHLDKVPGFPKNKWPDLDTPAWGATAGFSAAVPRASNTNALSSATPNPAASSSATAAGTPGLSGQQQGSGKDTSGHNSDQFSGTITAIDADARTLTVQGSSGEKKFHLDSNAQIRAGTENQAKLDDLKAGSHVNVEYKQESGKAVAKTVESASPTRRRTFKKSTRTRTSNIAAVNAGAPTWWQRRKAGDRRRPARSEKPFPSELVVLA